MKQNGYVKAVKAAFPYTIPVLTGYLFIGIAFGVMYQEKGYNFLWAILMSILVYAGSGQYLAVNFFAPGVSFLQIIFLEFMVNIRHVFYGLSLIEKFRDMGKKKLYMIFSLTDETYSLFFITKVPEGVDEHKFLFSIALLDQLYWIIGSAIGAIAGTLIPFDTTGIDFAMTALFVVIFVEQWLTSRNHLPALTGIAASLICLLIFGSDNFILPSMICIMIILLSGRKVMEEKEVAENADYRGPVVINYCGLRIGCIYNKGNSVCIIQREKRNSGNRKISWKSAAACSCGNACYLLLKGSKCSEVSLWSAGIYCSFRSYRFTCVEKK